MSSNFRLVVNSGPNPGQTLILDGTEFSIGRDINNDFVINDTEMSRKHAKIYIYGQGFVLEDLGSTNGTFVNGQRLTGIHQLVAGDTVAFGENVGCTFEAPIVDPDATRVSVQPPVYAPPVQQESPPFTPQETFISAPAPQQYQSAPPPVQASYSGEVPSAYPPAEKPIRKSKALLIIIILILLFICGCIVFWLVIDSLNLYCDLAPGLMNSIFGRGSCP